MFLNKDFGIDLTMFLKGHIEPARFMFLVCKLKILYLGLVFVKALE